MGKTKYLFRKIRDTNGEFSCKDGQNKRQKFGPTEAEDIKKRQQEYTE